MKTIQNMRYRDLAYIALNVSDLEKSKWYYEEMLGLQPNGGDKDHAFFRCSDKHHDIMLVQSHTPGLKRIGWRMESDEDCAVARHHFGSLGLETQSVPQEEAAMLGIGSNAFRMHQPVSGVVMEYMPAMQLETEAYQPTVARIERLGHIVVSVSDMAAVEKFCLEDMNLRISDRVGDAITFFRCFPNPLHHSFALSKSGSNHLHHVNFMVTEIDDIGKAMNRFKKNKVPVTFGPGRHPTSDSIFFYFADPDGHWMEYSFGMEEISEMGGRDARLFPLAADSIDTWGGRADRAYAQVGDIDSVF